MKKLLLVMILVLGLWQTATAQDLTAPEAPDHVQELLPEDRDSFGEGLWYVVKSSVALLRPDLAQAAGTCLSVIGAVMLISLLNHLEGPSQQAVRLCGVVAISVLLVSPVNALISLAAETIQELSNYAKLLLPVISAALAAQGGTATSAVLYTATAFVNSLLSSAVAGLLVPMVYIYLALSVVNAAVGDTTMDRLKGFVKWGMTWGLKLTLYAYTAYMSITGVISGTTDQAALKATKLTISGMVPVVGGILSDASETILLGAGVVKNAAGIYGLLAIFAIAIGPFFRIGVQYLLLKLTAGVCGIFADKKQVGILEDFSGAMGMLLAMTGTLCLMLLVSVVCFLKGVG